MQVDYGAFGKYLLRQRELRGLTREEVAQATRIPGNLIAALEEGELSRLPGRVFVLNYIRAYAEEIGLSPDDAVLRFEEIDQEQGAEPDAPAPPARKMAVARWGWVLVLFALVLVGILAATGHLPLHALRR